MRHNQLELNNIHSLILERLAFNPILAKSLPLVGLTRYQISKGFESNDETISQSSILSYTDELYRNGLLMEISKTKLSGKKFRILYDLTTFGLAKWCAYLKKKEHYFNSNKVNELITKSHRLVPWISENWTKLNELFQEEGLFQALQSASENIKVDFDVEQRFVIKSGISKKKILKEYRNPVVSTEASVEIKNVIFMVRGDAIPYDKVSERKEYNNAFWSVEELLTFMFLFNLTKVFLFPLDTTDEMLRQKKEDATVNKLFSIIKSDYNAKILYLRYIKKMKENYIFTNKSFAKITRLL